MALPGRHRPAPPPGAGPARSPRSRVVAVRGLSRRVVGPPTALRDPALPWSGGSRESTMIPHSEPKGSTEPLPTRSAELLVLGTRRVRLLGRVRVPLAGAYRPWARLYRFPDGRLYWTVRLWESTRAVTHVVPSERLLRYARASGLRTLEAEITTLLQRAVG